MKTREENIDDLIDDWHGSPDDGVPLHEYLGWTWEQYAHWVLTGKLP